MDVRQVAKLANLPLTADEADQFSTQFADTLKTISLIDSLDTSHTPPTAQVTGLINITRPDQLDPSRALTQDQALSNAPRTHNGYFVVPQVIAY